MALVCILIYVPYVNGNAGTLFYYLKKIYKLRFKTLSYDILCHPNLKLNLLYMKK
jgi:hypothetical protein